MFFYLKLHMTNKASHYYISAESDGTLSADVDCMQLSVLS